MHSDETEVTQATHGGGAGLPLSAVGALASGDGAVGAGGKVGMWAHAQGLRLQLRRLNPNLNIIFHTSHPLHLIHITQNHPPSPHLTYHLAPHTPSTPTECKQAANEKYLFHCFEKRRFPDSSLH